ncbi:MAG: hypothetical protein ABW167_14375 [Baekduia sp.]
MTQIAPTPFAAASPWEACDQCQAPLEPRQRYCVACGSRRLHGDDPAARYLAEATRRARAGTPVATAPAPRRPTSLGTLALALIPLAAALGVLAGRSQAPSDELIVNALKAQRAPVVNVTGAVGGAATPTAAGGETTASSSKKSAAKNQGSSGGKRTSDGARVLATGPAGSARQLEGSKVTGKQLSESKQAVKRINESKGKAYVESQRNLPDQIVIP